MWKRSRSSKLPEISSFKDLKYAKKSGAAETRREYSSSIIKVTYKASTPKFGRTFFPDRGGGRLARGFSGITASSSLEEKPLPSKTSESSTLSSSTTFLCFGEAFDVVGAMDVDFSSASANSSPGHSPPSG
jgi:hypothetical protein